MMDLLKVNQIKLHRSREAYTLQADKETDKLGLVSGTEHHPPTGNILFGQHIPIEK